MKVCIYGLGILANRLKCDAVDWVKRNTLRLFGHMERKKSEEFFEKSIYE